MLKFNATAEIYNETGNWSKVRVKGEKEVFSNLRAKVRAYPQDVEDEAVIPELRRIAQEGVGVMQHIISTSKTGGQTYKRKGGGIRKVPVKIGRKDTGTMHRSVGYRVRRGSKSTSVFVGWYTGKPGYAIFHEMGTDRLAPMRATVAARDHIERELLALPSKIKRGVIDVPSRQTWHEG